jgi:hypothetical protein
LAIDYVLVFIVDIKVRLNVARYVVVVGFASPFWGALRTSMSVRSLQRLDVLLLLAEVVLYF